MKNTERAAQQFERTARELEAAQPPDLSYIFLVADLLRRAEQVRAGEGELESARKMIDDQKRRTREAAVA